MSGASSSSPAGAAFTVFTFFVAIIFVLAPFARAQNGTQPTTDPSEVRALNSIFNQWKIKANTQQWNTTGDPCSGAAVDDSSFDDVTFNPFIKCDCSFNNSSLCHITQLKVYALDAVGPIPEELWSLTFLFNLNLAQNFLTGSLSPSIGNLTKMQYLSLGINALSGELPKELGQLTELLSVSLVSNNFFGPLPPELGNLNKLEQLYIDSAGFSGEIPSTFANLQSMQTLWASDNEFTGKIPDFIGNWTNLNTLRLQGNSFEGPIPSTFANLTSLKDLRLSEISNVSSSLAFIKDMKSLIILILRNNNIADSIPLNIGDYQQLIQLDLSFNNINGQIPDSLFTMSSLSILFLGNNSLTGTLPQQKKTSLHVIDLSYNNLVGNLPSWVNQENLQLNLVGGGSNFNIKSLKKSVLPSGLNCLQQNFPCNRGKGIYYNFGINCGGPEMTPSNGILYERDNETLGPATYYVSSTERWAVSNVGSFSGNNNASYTLESALFQTSRLSASSLRYYGLGLENGAYTVNLEFAETASLTSSSWKSNGRRVFDIYIQGKLVLKDFDMRKEAGGVYPRFISKTYKVRVSENYLEIHLFWAGKGTCCIPAQGTYGSSISAISASPDFIPTVSNIPPTKTDNGTDLILGPPTKKNKRTDLIVGASVGIGVSIFFCVLGILYFLQRKKKSQNNYNNEELLGMDVKPFTFSYAELKMATNDFSSANKLGEGGFGIVYKGTLEDGRVVAIKQLSVTSHHGKSQFIAEIATISAVQHRHLVKLYGCCLEGDKRLLVYEYLENKSLDRALFDHSLKLDWATRFNICLGVARGLSYLHEESHIRIVHRDIKASNILLDSNLNPKISDFGLAKFYDDKKTHISTCVAGTFGYLAPEYAMSGHLTEKADVFAFGVVALEIVCGRPRSDLTLEQEKVYLLEWAWNLHERKREVELVDLTLSSEFKEEEVVRVVEIALLCTQTSPFARPPMSRVVAMLLGDVEVNQKMSRPGYFSDWRFSDVSSIVSDIAANVSGNNHYYSSSSLNTMEVDLDDKSPTNTTRPMLSQSKVL
ncbi:probable LRR receptor-like serine/threonine-protein kinase At1g56130 isoform X1 [Humulus lupulus]|uniref:probable LRR receptor-like serine/threonine-protein kinase At1g56130 isoform X1 n=1 Tax=Humulus lupulus TaxID=3486 RepID=UPI002B4029A3|nr:probable LRR receptor-like serine/threonine-protein kinase At1g56130 isoform X1 [Humulus lupulus]